MHEHDSIFEQMTDRGHERLCFHHDEETGLKAIVAIHSTALGNALGGTRRWYYESEEDAIFDVLRLSKGMTYKAAVSGLPMGGAKSVILLPHRDQQRTESEARATQPSSRSAATHISAQISSVVVTTKDIPPSSARPMSFAN